jgi:1,2-phenylacetyl-CoA epoxidase catalytic subunit
MAVEPLEEPISADATFQPLIDAEQQAAADAAQDDKRRGVLRFYELAKKQEWQVRDMPWGEIPPIPETRAGASDERKERRRAVWRSVITQQLQADELAVSMAGQLLNLAPHREAKLYYSTMVQDEARHVEAWLKLAEQAGGVAERDPHLDELAKMTLEAETLEEKVFQMQVFFERLIIPRFRLIARSSRGTLLEDLCNRLTIDDGIHHSAGVAYERVLLENASRATKDRLVQAANRLLPIFVEHALWRPKERAWIGNVMRETDIRRLQDDVRDGIRMARSLGLDVSDIELPFAA